ncbi:MAG TPA: DPP IV N-terminal domain-containing protein [Terriglobales bacterium]
MKRIVPFVVVLLASIPALAQQQGKKPLTVEAIVAPGGLTGRAPENIQWSPDGKRLSYVQRDDSGEHGELWYIDPNTGEKKVLVSEGKLASLAPDVNKIKNEIQREKITRYSVAAYHWSPDSKHLLFDSLGQLWMYSLDTGTAVQFTSAPQPSEDPKFSPDGARVAYLRQHNLYVRPSGGGDEKQLTRNDKKDAKDDDILNGEVDWVYEEELNVRSNYFWSPDSSAIVFLQMDETRVPTYPITDYLPVNAEVQNEKYPKPGDPNPIVRLGVASVKGGGVKWISLTDNPDTYVPRFGWVRDGVLWAEVLNRTQDTLDLYFIEAKSGRSHKVLSESSKDAWVDVNNDFHVLKSGDRFTWSSWRTGHTHLYLYSFDKNNPLAADAKLEKQLEDGSYEMLGVQGIDEEARTVYVSANKDDPRQEQLYSVKLDGSGLQQVSKEPGTHTVTFADDGKHYVDTYSANLVPPKRSVCAATGSPCYPFWESRSIAQYDWIAPKDIELKAGDGATTMYAQLVMPSAPPSDKVPLIVYIYGGPAGQTVRNTWADGVTDPFNQMMAEHGYAIFSVDNRGTPNRGRDFMASAIRHQFGGVELKDQLTALDQLFAQNPSLDKTRVCIWGWSNGGSMTMYSLLHSRAYKCGISGAPVTDWHLYDSIYTERYLGLPKDNPKVYDESSMPAAAANLNDSLLLIHGTSDDNVHIQNSIQMINGLINAKKQFRLMLYPGKTHGVTGDARIHLFHMMQDFFEENLK